MNIQNRLLPLAYVLFAGVIPSLMFYFLFFKLLAIVEGGNLSEQVVAVATLLSPIAGPIFGALLFYKLVKPSASNGTAVSLWKGTLISSLGVMVLAELYLWKFDPLWSGFGIILLGAVGITLAIFSYIKDR